MMLAGTPLSGSPIAQEYLDPPTSLGEVLFGLIMTLTFTLGAGLIIEEEGREGARQLLIATIGCNIAWGIIDGATLASVWLMFFASLPAAIPFLLIDDALLALRVSNAVLLLLLFFTGYRWAHYTFGRPWLVGFCFLIGGLALVCTAIALGG